MPTMPMPVTTTPTTITAQRIGIALWAKRKLHIANEFLYNLRGFFSVSFFVLVFAVCTEFFGI